VITLKNTALLLFFRKESTASCSITKANNNCHFHPSHFFRSYFPPASVNDFFLPLSPFPLLEIKKECVQRRVTIPQGQLPNKVKPCSKGTVFGWMTKYEYPVL